MKAALGFSWLTLALVVVSASLATAEERPSKPAREFVDIPARGTIRFETSQAEDAVPEHFRLQPHEFEFETRFLQSGGKFRLLRLTYPSPVITEIAENNTVHAEYFQPAGAGPFPACVVLHILGGDFVLAETVAAHLARQGIAALFVKMPYYGPRRRKDSSKRMISEDPRETVAGMTQAVLDIRRATTWLAAQKEVDPERLGITGISLGGIMSALAATGEPRLKNVAVVLGGGNFAELVWSNETQRAARFREKWTAAGGTRESFGDVVGKVDPAAYGHLLKGRRVLMVAAKNDEIIPPASATALWESIGREPELVWLDAGHYSAIKYLPRELVRLDMFFNAKAP
ncbi:MAG TPA: alpha/beta hydrolase family protein [Planctomycetaceae bacterium]|nr:alpha/beta hydrolase family protein [Planctomycetaceae bacterium]